MELKSCFYVVVTLASGHKYISSSFAWSLEEARQFAQYLISNDGVVSVKIKHSVLEL